MEYVTLTHERNRRLSAAVRKKMASERLERVTRKLLQEVLNEPVDRGFFVSVDHIIVMDRRRREGKLPQMKEMTAKMWREIFSEIDNYLASHPGDTLTNAAIHVASRAQASQFFINPANAQRIINSSKL